MTMQLKDLVSPRILLLVSDWTFQSRFLAGLRNHSIDDPVTSKKIETALSITGATVRDVVRTLRLSGLPVGSDGKGYYWCTSHEQLDPTLDHLRSRHQALGYLIARVERTQSAVRNGEPIQERLML